MGTTPKEQGWARPHGQIYYLSAQDTEEGNARSSRLGLDTLTPSPKRTKMK